MAHEWDSFLSAADEWIINYSLPSPFLTGVKLFSIGHAFELYLKAANTKITSDMDHAISFAHDLPAIWRDCKAKDPNFLPGYDLREAILKRNLLDFEDYSKLSKDDVMHFLKHQEFYVVAKYLADLKYLGAPLKKVQGAYALCTIFPNPQWGELLRDFRKYLGHPRSGKLDLIQYHIEQGELPAFSVQFLKAII
ncbi:MAG: hypothetical protein LAN62_11550 [Acidobacteriia bacterium]|nr:hypothetical protein [Terriglobia bacterium]